MSSAGGSGGGSGGSGDREVEFSSAKSDVAGALAVATKGLVSKAEFSRRREELEKVQEAEAAAEASAGSAEKKKSKKKKPKLSSVLSFNDDDEGDASEAVAVPKKLKKNPNVDTGFLPDKEREAALQASSRARLPALGWSHPRAAKDVPCSPVRAVVASLVPAFPQLRFSGSVFLPAASFCRQRPFARSFLRLLAAS